MDQFIPNVTPVSETKMEHYLRQVAEHIVTILTKPPSTIYRCLTVGDPVQNALLEITTQLKVAEPLHEAHDLTTTWAKHS